MNQLRNCLAPAKLNLFLHIVGLRPDGYHELQSVMVLTDWCDMLHFTTTDNGEIGRVSEHVYANAQNDIVVKAAQLLQTQFSVSKGVLIEIDKKIPCGAGMGGGSSDAATTLFALNHLWGLGLNRRQLMAIGARLGADVPFFLSGGSAFIEGVGEKIIPIQLPKFEFLVCYPWLVANTAKIFKAFDAVLGLTGFRKKIRIDDFLEAVSGGSSDIGSLELYVNDLQPIAVKVFPELGQFYTQLKKYGIPKMTGSGSTFFVHQVGDKNQINKDCLARLGITKHVKTLDSHPFIVYDEWGVAKLVKAPDFDSGMRRFESFFPSQE
jgi:4-diphosphocytidyl-2-C-methyl-D-erythritol kinase